MRFRDHTHACHVRKDSSGAVNGALPYSSQHSEKTDIHATGGIRTRNPSKRTAVEPLLRPWSHRDRQPLLMAGKIFIAKWFSKHFKLANYSKQAFPRPLVEQLVCTRLQAKKRQNICPKTLTVAQLVKKLPIFMIHERRIFKSPRVLRCVV